MARALGWTGCAAQTVECFQPAPTRAGESNQRPLLPFFSCSILSAASSWQDRRVAPFFVSFRPGHRGQPPRVLAVGCIPSSGAVCGCVDVWMCGCVDVWCLHDGGNWTAHEHTTQRRQHFLEKVHDNHNMHAIFHLVCAERRKQGRERYSPSPLPPPPAPA
jgi:hypothetical protein